MFHAFSRLSRLLAAADERFNPEGDDAATQRVQTLDSHVDLLDSEQKALGVDNNEVIGDLLGLVDCEEAEANISAGGIGTLRNVPSTPTSTHSPGDLRQKQVFTDETPPVGTERKSSHDLGAENRDVLEESFGPSERELEDSSRSSAHACTLPVVKSTSNSTSQISDSISTQVLEALRGTANTATCGKQKFDRTYKLFEICTIPPGGRKTKVAIPSPGLSSKCIAKLAKLLKENPDVVNSRSANMATLSGLPDGCTLLHAACFGGHAEVVSYLLQEHILKDSTADGYGLRLSFDDRDLLGRTPLHVAAERGDIQIVEILKDAYRTLEDTRNCTDLSEVVRETKGSKTKNTLCLGSSPSKSPQHSFSGSNAPLDLANRTPLALASTSPLPKAKENRKFLEETLFSKGDPGIEGSVSTPATERCGGHFSHLYVSPTTTEKIVMRQQPRYIDPPNCKDDFQVVNRSKLTGILWGHSDKQGWLFIMEDAMYHEYPIPLAPLPPSYSISNAHVPLLGLFGVFDGHGDGGFVSNYVSKNLLDKMRAHPEWPSAYYLIDSQTSHEGNHLMKKVLMESFHTLDEDLKNDPIAEKGGGSTAVVAVISDTKIFVANIGDSRCILVKKQSDLTEGKVSKENEWNLDTLEVSLLSQDHTANLPCERERVEAAGLQVRPHPIYNEDKLMPKVIHKIHKSKNDALSVTRSFGDFEYKANNALPSTCQAVICTPETLALNRQQETHMYLVLACDGIWDVMSNEEVGLFVANKVVEYCANGLCFEENEHNDLAPSSVLAKVGDALLELCLDKKSKDNLSVLIVAFPASGLGEYVAFMNESRGSNALDGVKRLDFS